MMTPAEQELRRHVEAGLAVVANQRKAAGHRELIAWAERAGLLVLVDRSSPFGNPFTISRDGNRKAVCELYAQWLTTRPDLIARLPELRGKVLACWCSPKRCHADLLAQLANVARPSGVSATGGTLAADSPTSPR